MSYTNTANDNVKAIANATQTIASKRPDGTGDLRGHIQNLRCGNVDNGAIPCHTKEAAYNELNSLYLQSRLNVEPPYSCDDFDDTTYFVQSEDGLDWERGEILEKDF